MNDEVKKAILEEIKKKLEEPIPNFWKASITLGRTTELEYYSKVIVGHTFCNRQKDRLRRRLFSQFVKKLKELVWGHQPDELGHYTKDEDIHKLIKEYQEKIK